MQMVEKKMSDNGSAASYPPASALQHLLNRATMITINAYCNIEIPILRTVTKLLITTITLHDVMITLDDVTITLHDVTP